MSRRHDGAVHQRPSTAPRRRDAQVLAEQLPLFDVFEKDGEAVTEPICGGCGMCAYTPLARSPRARKRKP
jgi:hypothetical protein